MATLITLVDGTIPVAADFNANFVALNSEVRPANTGGTGQSTYVTGDLLYSSATNTLSRLAAGSTGLTLTMMAGLPAWGAGNASSPGVIGLTGTNNVATPTSKYDLLANYVTLRNPSSGAVRTVVPTTLTNDIAAATTTNGRDQGAAFSTSSWVYMYYVGTGSGAPTTLSSASSTGPTLLAGQTEWALATAIFNDSTPKLAVTAARGSRVWNTIRQTALTTGASTTEATVSLTAFIPPIALSCELATQAKDSSVTLTLRVVSGSDFMLLGTPNQGAPFQYGQSVELPNISQQFFYLWGGAGGALTADILGYKIPNGDS
jgi:hypothetical protein